MSDKKLLLDMFVRGSSPTFTMGWRDLHEHRNFSFPSLGGDQSRLIDFGRPGSFSLKEFLQEDPSEPFLRRRMLKIGVQETVNSIMLVNKNTVAAGA